MSQLASIEETDGPNQVSRDDGRRRIVLSANTQGRALSDVVADIRQAEAIEAEALDAESAPEPVLESEVALEAESPSELEPTAS